VRTTGSWEDLLVFDTFGYVIFSVLVRNLGTNGNAIKYRLLGSHDEGDTFPVTVTEATTVDAGKSKKTSTFQALTTVKVQVRDESGSDDAEAQAVAKR